MKLSGESDGRIFRDAAREETWIQGRPSCSHQKCTLQLPRTGQAHTGKHTDIEEHQKGRRYFSFFTRFASELKSELPKLISAIDQIGMIWISWPKKSSGVPSTVTEGTIRTVALPSGLVDVKVCAVDDTWSGLELVMRKELRK